MFLGTPALLQAQEMSDEQTVAYRVGQSFDKEELDYFGIASTTGLPLDSMTYGVERGAFTLTPYFGDQSSKQIVLTPNAQREFLRLIANYEELVREPQSFNPSVFQGLPIRVTLTRRERNGRFAELTTRDRQYFGEVAFVKNGWVGFYLVDLGYRAQLAETELKVLPLDSIRQIEIYKRTLGRYAGLSLGLAAGAGMTAFQSSLTSFDSDEANYAVQLVALPALGFALGYLFDISLGFSSRYSSSDQARSAKGKSKLSQHVMFGGQLPPELARKVRGRQAGPMP